jgi:hypothetical protein
MNPFESMDCIVLEVLPYYDVTLEVVAAVG